MNQAEKSQKIIFAYWKKIPALKTVEDFEEILEDLHHIANDVAVAKVKEMMWKQAQAVGVDWDGEKKKFVYGEVK